MVEVVRGREVTVTFDGKRCIHSRNCVLGHPEVFRAGGQGRRIFPDAATAENGDPYRAELPLGARSASAAMRAPTPPRWRRW